MKRSHGSTCDKTFPTGKLGHTYSDFVPVDVPLTCFGPLYSLLAAVTQAVIPADYQHKNKSLGTR
jgi:hypothetical protein